MVACNCSLSCESPINFGQLFSVVTVAAKIFNEFYLLTPFCAKTVFVLSPRLHPRPSFTVQVPL